MHLNLPLLVLEAIEAIETLCDWAMEQGMTIGQWWVWMGGKVAALIESVKRPTVGSDALSEHR